YTDLRQPGSFFTEKARLWPLPHAEGSLLMMRKKTLRSKSSSLVRSTPGGGVVSSAGGLAAGGGSAVALRISEAFFEQAAPIASSKISFTRLPGPCMPRIGLQV